MIEFKNVAGNFLTQTFSVVLTTLGVFLLTFATWQYSITEPSCCYAAGNNVSAQALAGVRGEGPELLNWNANCSELQKGIILGGVSLHMTPDLILALAVIGLVVKFF